MTETHVETDLEIQKLNDKPKNNYTTGYRWIKTILLLTAWVSFGWNAETPKAAFEDLKILLNTNYYYMGLLMINLNTGYFVSAIMAGLVIDNFFKYSNVIIALSHLLFVTTIFFIPWSKLYWLSCLLYFLQGFFLAVFDICSSRSILRLWEGISASPINGIHAAYGIGGILASQVINPYLKFNDIIEKNISNSTQIGSNDIELKQPFSYATICGLVICFIFLLSQYYESKTMTVNTICTTKEESETKSLNEFDSYVEHVIGTLKYINFQKLLFQKTFSKRKAICLNFLQIILICALFFSVYSFLMSGSYLLTYLTKGPTKLSVNEFMKIQTTFWLFFIIGRIAAVFIGYKLNAFLFYALLLITTFLALICFALPFLHTNYLYFIISLMGFASGPLLPSAFMIATNVLKNVNSAIIALCLVSSTLGAIVCLYTTGYLLDNFKPRYWFSNPNATSVYIIPFIMIFYIFLSMTMFMFVFVVYVFSKDYLKSCTVDIEKFKLLHSKRLIQRL